MGDHGDRDDDPLVVTGVVPPPRRWLVAVYAVQVVIAVLLLLDEPHPLRWLLVLLWVVGFLTVAGGGRWVSRHPPQVALGREGLSVRSSLGRTRRFAWEDVSRLAVDPPGGPRTLTLFERPNGFRRLLVLREEDVEPVRERWERVRQSPASSRPER